MSIIDDPFEDLGKVTKALKVVLDAEEQTIEKLPPVERLMAQSIRKSFKSDAQ